MNRFVVTGLLSAVSAALGAETPVVSWDKARDAIGRQATVEGTVAQTRKSEKVCHLNFSANWRTDFSVTIFAGSFARWPGDIESLYRGKRVRVTGLVKEYQGRPEIVVSEPGQIEIVGDKPAVARPPALETPAPPPPMTNAGASVMTVPERAEDTPRDEKASAPFTVEVKRFTGARRSSGIETRQGSSFMQTARIEVTLRNTSGQPVSDIEWQWVTAVLDISGSGDTRELFYSGGANQLALKPFEARLLKSDDVTLAGLASGQGMRSGHRLRGHYVRVFHKGRQVAEDATPAAMKGVAENYLKGNRRAPDVIGR
jgi:micrococcal nuclease